MTVGYRFSPIGRVDTLHSHKHSQRFILIDTEILLVDQQIVKWKLCEEFLVDNFDEQNSIKHSLSNFYGYLKNC